MFSLDLIEYNSMVVGSACCWRIGFTGKAQVLVLRIYGIVFMRRATAESVWSRFFLMQNISSRCNQWYSKEAVGGSTWLQKHYFQQHPLNQNNERKGKSDKKEENICGTNKKRDLSWRFRLALQSDLIYFEVNDWSLSGSVSIAADAINSLSDTASSILTLVGFKIAAKPADPEHPYGHDGLNISAVCLFRSLSRMSGFNF